VSRSPFTVPAEAAGQRLDVFLAAISDHTRSRIQQQISAGTITVNGRPCPARYLVRTGDAIVIAPTTAPTPTPTTTTEPDLPIIYEDDDLLVIDKPAGLVVHPGAGAHDQPTVADFARPRTTDPDADRPGIVHRLDRDTSGLLLIAKHVEAKQYLQNLLRHHQIGKTYTALVIGRPSQDSAVISLPIGRDRTNPLRQAVIPNGRPSTTSYHCTAFYPGYTLVSARPETGRTHQLRVHFAAIGHPIAGDTTYGQPSRQLGLTRQFLHAAELEFTAPNGTPLKLLSPLSPDLSACLSKLDLSV
jgi:23S rRNA pseudouridine1911/1915/1917 synthase